MTVKEASVLNFYWHQLSLLTFEYDRGVSAGELAKYLGVSRTTAQKYLKALVKNKAAWAIKQPHWNGSKVTQYQPLEEAK